MIKKAKEINKDIPNSVILNQFENDSNPNIHYRTTAKKSGLVAKEKLTVLFPV